MQFKIKDLVLLYQSQLRGKQKLQERWKDSYYVHEMFIGNGAYKLHMIKGKILKVLPTEVVAFPPPYTVTAGLKEKFDLINAAIERAKRIDDRILMLQLSLHFRMIAIRTYYIFKISGVEQIMRMIHLTTTIIWKLGTAEYKDLVLKSIDIFNGVENLGGNGVNRIIM
ncbi:unnamed protein product [Rhizophagus irregularis]|nr:unnamed protein product [Rhizophagus irregularis]CAB5378359.1 unnamed protein product [Rhizophagus irregularis]